MTSSTFLFRLLWASVVVASLSTAGCGWLRKGNKLYTADVTSRPLEVPPELDMPGAETNLASGSPKTTAAATSSSTVTPLGFTVDGSRDDIFDRLDAVLGKTEGLTVASRAKLLGAFDVKYGGSNFLVRVSQAQAGVYVSAVDPRGLPANGEAPAKLIESLKAAFGAR